MPLRARARAVAHNGKIIEAGQVRQPPSLQVLTESKCNPRTELVEAEVQSLELSGPRASQTLCEAQKAVTSHRVSC
jgi:hypothetical protein